MLSQIPVYRFLDSIQYEHNSNRYPTRKYFKTLFYRYLLAVVFTFAIFALKIYLQPFVPEESFLLDIVAVILASYVGGFGPGLFAMGLSIAFNPGLDIFRITIFAVESVLISMLNSLRVYAEHREMKQGQVIAHERYHDTLTNLPNKRYLDELLSDSIFEANIKKEGLSVLHINLDRFKNINETLGHATGDLVLKEVGYRLQHLSRSSDIVARIGGDEFVMLVRGEVDKELVVMLLKQIMKDLDTPIAAGTYRLPLSAAIGVAMYPEDGATAPQLLTKADAAAQNAKRKGRRNFQFYNKKFDLSSPDRLQLENDLRGALRNGELEIHYQPIVSLKNIGIPSIELLLRWNHPTRGTLMPFDFIDLAEDLGIMLEITEWTIREASAQNVQRIKDGFPKLVISINLSARQFSDREFLERIPKVLREVGMESELLQLEITETAAMENIALTIDSIAMLKKEGIRIAIDDFGTGYSSLSYLKNLSADTLKIDKSFVKDFVSAKKDGAIVQAVIALGHSLGMNVVAEGVEQDAQLVKLRTLECDAIQGYVISRPFTEIGLKDWLRGRTHLVL